ncbi:MAG: electron transport complex subunit RsxA [Lachnospiraceae bacterium]|nr:electron transport complex subunit RsxA [Lachnospiraceae bacterium]
MTKLIYAAIISAFINNLVLTRTFGTNSLIRDSRDYGSAIRLGVSILIITSLSSVITWPIGRYLLEKFNLSALETIVFLLIEAAVVWLLLALVRKISEKKYQQLSPLLTLTIANSAVLGIILNNVSVGYSFVRSTVFSIFGAIGFGITLILMAGIRERIRYNDVPQPFEGVPILLVTAALMAIAFYGFTGLI